MNTKQEFNVIFTGIFLSIIEQKMFPGDSTKSEWKFFFRVHAAFEYIVMIPPAAV